MIHRLFQRQLRNGRQHAKRIGRQEHDVPGVAANAGNHRIADEVDGIGRAGILGDRIQIEQQGARVRIDDDVFQDGAKALGSRVDFGFGFSREIDYLGVTSAFKVEDAVIAPAMLIITD